MKQIHDIAVLQEFLLYDPTTGAITWRKSSNRKIKVGRVAGSVAARGHINVRFDGRTYKAHRLAWALHYGVWPSLTIDHKNQVPSDNRIENLRDVPISVNNENRRNPPKNNRVGFLGVTRCRDLFAASIQVAGKRMSLGRFASAEDAHAAYVVAKRQFHEGCTL